MDLFNLLLPLCRTTSKKRPDLYLSHFLATLLELLLLISQKKVVKKFSIFLDRLGSRKRLREFCLGKFPS